MNQRFKQYTQGQVIDNIKPGQYAIKVNGNDGIYEFEHNDLNFTHDLPALFCDPNTLVIEFVDGKLPVLNYETPDKQKDKFIILTETEYQNIVKAVELAND